MVKEVRLQNYLSSTLFGKFDVLYRMHEMFEALSMLFGILQVEIKFKYMP